MGGIKKGQNLDYVIFEWYLKLTGSVAEDMVSEAKVVAGPEAENVVYRRNSGGFHSNCCSFMQSYFGLEFSPAA